MDRSTIIEAVAMYWPLALCASLYLLLDRNHRSEKKRVLAAGMMAATWIAAVLPWVNDLCVRLGYWRFEVSHAVSILGLPLSFYIGWIILWGFLPALLAVWLEKMSPAIFIATFFLLDVLTMPLFSPVMSLVDSHKWLIGESLLVLLCLTPATYLSLWVIRDTRVGMRSGLISAAFILIILTIIPVAAPTASFHPIAVWHTFPSYQQYLYALALILLSLPGIAGVVEFARIGKGTPIPYDPPKRLITTGVYMYVRNPMQLSMVLVIIMWAIVFSSWLMLCVAVVALVYSIGLARWSESCDLRKRYGVSWENYRCKVKSWRLSLVPTFTSERDAELYIDTECSKCLEVKCWLVKKIPINLAIVSASQWSGKKLTRMTYHDPNTGETAQGVLAFSKAIQHIHLGWAFLAWFISLPVVNSIVQAALDAGGAAPRKVSARDTE